MKCTNTECTANDHYNSWPPYETCPTCNGKGEIPEPITLGENGQRIVASLKEHQEDLQQIVDSKADTLTFTRHQ